jgi:DNA-directed RNA polymerase beta' subunit
MTTIPGERINENKAGTVIPAINKSQIVTQEFLSEINTNVELNARNPTNIPVSSPPPGINIENFSIANMNEYECQPVFEEETRVILDPEYKINITRVEDNALHLQLIDAIENLPEEEVVGIEFRMKKREEIEKYVRVNSSADEGPGTINDSKLGVVKGNQSCGSCHLDVMTCSGHHGRIQLQQAFFDNNIKILRDSPMINPLFRRETISFLTIFCNYCGALYLTEDQILDIERHTYATNRIKLIEEYVKNKRNLPHTHRDSKIECIPGIIQGEVAGCVPNPQYILDKKRNIHKIEYKQGNGQLAERTIEDIVKIFNRITPEDAKLLGLGKNMPIDFIMYDIIVIPPRQRGASAHETENESDRMAPNYIDIIKANNILIAGKDNKGNLLKPEDIDKYKKIIYDKTKAIMSSSETKGSRGQNQVSVSALLKGKEGLMREGIQAARADYIARTVIDPDPTVAFGEFSVPYEFASKLTVAKKVYQTNLAELNKLLQEQRITHILRGSGIQKGKRIVVNPDNYLDIWIHIGDTVDRWLQNGDYLTLNRMPSLHKQSLMTGKVILRNQRHIGIKLAYTPAYNADFDGDEMNLHSVQTIEATAEVEYLMNMTQCLPNEQNNSNMMGSVMDIPISSYLLTSEDEIMSEGDWNNYLMLISATDSLGNLDERLLEMGVRKYTGKALFSAMLPPNLYYSNKGIKIINGILVHGIVTKDHIGPSANSLIQTIYNTPTIMKKSKECGLNRAAQFITDIDRVLGLFITKHGFTIGLRDCGYDIPDVEKIKKEELVKMRVAVSQLGGKVGVSLETDKYEDQMLVITNNYKSNVGARIKSLVPANNNFNIMISAKSKGNLDNFVKIAASVSQQTFGGKRMPRQISSGKRSLPHFEEGDMDPASEGFVESGFLKGLNPVEFYFHAGACREGIINTAVDMSTVGMSARNLSTMLGDCKVAYDGSTRDSNFMVVQDLYGGDGFSGGSLQKLIVNEGSPNEDETLNLFDVRALAKEINAKHGWF